jgi:hypothetical protein
MPKVFATACAFLAFGLLLPTQSFAESHAKSATVAVGGAHKSAVAPDAREFLSPFSTVYAGVKFHDDGTTMTVNGKGGGFNPGLSYTSFFYGTGSVSKGALACFPPTPNNLTAPQMITAYWLPVTSSYRTLYVAKTGTSYVSLSQVSTFSVRYDSTPTLPLTTNLNPGRFWLDSCGYIF